ncbi:MAG: ATP-binding cassette domain-containing protein [Actinomycetota bacterium]
MTTDPIVVEDLAKNFGSVEALKGISFSVPAGTVFGLLGPNGAGKTTAIRILTTLIPADRGNATVLGHDVVKTPNEVRRLIGLAGQYAAVDGLLSGSENLRMIGRLTHLPKPQIRQRADELLDVFGLSDAADRPVRTYSGGMRRRLDLAAALVHRPPVLFLDEPTTGLDPQSRSDLWETIRQLVADGTTVLLTTQYLDEADRLANDIVVVDRGEIIAQGRPADLKAKLGDTVLEFSFADEESARRAESLLAKVNHNAPEREGALIRLSSPQGASLLVDVLRKLDAENLTPSKLNVREPSLDDVFLSLTGRHAEPADGEGEPQGKRAQRQLARAGGGR